MSPKTSFLVGMLVACGIIACIVGGLSLLGRPPNSSGLEGRFVDIRVGEHAHWRGTLIRREHGGVTFRSEAGDMGWLPDATIVSIYEVSRP